MAMPAEETNSAVNILQDYIKRIHEFGEKSEDPLAPLSLLYSMWVAALVDFHGDKLWHLTRQFESMAKKQKSQGLDGSYPTG